jgi:hypothetical protein
MAKVMFDDYEVEAIRHLAKCYSDGGKSMCLAWFPRFKEVGEEKVRHVAGRLANFGMFRWDSTDSGEILAHVLDVADNIDNPPLRDYWDDATKWFRSKRWSLLVLVLYVGIPAAVAWIVAVKTIIEYCFRGILPK